MIVFYTTSVSPHQVPLARELVARVGADNYRYIHTEKLCKERRCLGWGDVDEPWIMFEGDAPEKTRRLLAEADVVMTTLRCLDVMEARGKAGKLTYYCSESWFKPVPVPGFASLRFPGRARMLSPGFRRMARRFSAIVRKYGSVRVLPYGVHAMEDFRRIGISDAKMSLWGYFVEGRGGDSLVDRVETCRDVGAKVLWVGRLLKLKRIDTIIRAVGELSMRQTCSAQPCVTLDIYGIGPEEKLLRRMAAKYGDCIRLHSAVPVAAVRRIMREHDIFVLASDAREGWGAVVGEALEEGMCVIGTREVGASATLLPDDHLFSSGDVHGLAERLSKWRSLSPNSIGEWSVENGANRFLKMCGISAQSNV